MKVNAGWYYVRKDLESVLDSLFQLAPEDFVEFDSLLSVEELDELGYVRNFPHLTCVLCALDTVDLQAFSRQQMRLSREYSPSQTSMGLLPATCYKVYLERKGQALRSPAVIGCIAKCFRHEDKPLDSYRGYNFTMKEFVCLGDSEDTKRHVERGRAMIDHLMAELDLPFRYETASDPFFDMSGSVATMSKALPTKQEVVYDGHAVASLNLHRNYFGRKFSITLNGDAIHSSCVAFGLERWVAMLQNRYGESAAARERIARVAPLASSLDRAPRRSQDALASPWSQP